MRWGASDNKDVSQSAPEEACCPGRPTSAGSWFGIGAIGTALATAICCLGPLLFSVLGLRAYETIRRCRRIGASPRADRVSL
jgi:hypothetical protein